LGGTNGACRLANLTRLFAAGEPLKEADTTWVEPRLDAEIAFAEINDGLVRAFWLCWPQRASLMPAPKAFAI
jgi:hypothetical protein